MNIDEELRNVGLTRELFEAVMSDIQDKKNGIQDLEWSEIIDKYKIDVKPEFLRKANTNPWGGAFVKEYYEEKYSGSTPPSYAEQMEELRKEKQRLSDERTALRKKSRDDARAEENLNRLADLIRESGKTVFSPYYPNVKDKGNDLIVCLSDLHIGIKASTAFGRYDSDIAKDRMCQYLVDVIKIQKMHGSQNVYITCLGDLISGNIHPTIQLENRENVVKQVQMASEYISAFAYELSKHFQNVYVADVPGNHSRISLKDNALRDERLDDLIVWYMKAKLSHIKNIKFIEDKYDATISAINVRGNEFLLTHGDFDNFSESGLNKLCMFIGHKPTGIFLGHLHHCSFDDINDVKLIRSGSFAGTCDNYTIQKRLYSKPSQMVCVVNGDGVLAFYPVMLK